MDDTHDKLSEHAQSQPRDEQGHFISEHTKTIKSPHITEHSEVKGTGNLLEKLVHVQEDKASDETLLDVKFSNPLHRIIEILQEIKQHQATTISLRFTIPLIALPIALFVFFQLGKAESNCNTYTTTVAGTLKVITVSEPQDKDHFYTPLLNLIPFYTPVHDSKDSIMKMRTVVISPQGDPVTLIHKTDINPIPYNNKAVLATGLMNSCHNTLTVEYPQNISAL